MTQKHTSPDPLDADSGTASSWEGERIAKIIARSGICSRRDAEAFINQGRVELDGQTVETPATKVRPDQVITLDGEALPTREPARLWRLYKPKGVLTTAFDPEGRPTIYNILPEDLPRAMPVGRLDMSSEGLLLLTNDGELKRRLELPQTGWIRRYRVRVYGRVDERALRDLAKGITVDGIKYGPIEARLDKSETSNSWLTVALREGKNREVRRICEQLGLTVNRLMRISFGPFVLGSLKPGDLEEVLQKTLKEQLGDGEKAKKKAAQSPRTPDQRNPQASSPKRSKAPQAPRHFTKDTRPLDEDGNPIDSRPAPEAKPAGAPKTGKSAASEAAPEPRGRHARNRQNDKAERDRKDKGHPAGKPRATGYSGKAGGKPGGKAGPKPAAGKVGKKSASARATGGGRGADRRR